MKKALKLNINKLVSFKWMLVNKISVDLQAIKVWDFRVGDPVTALTENSPISGSSLKKAEIFFGYFDIYSYTKWVLER